MNNITSINNRIRFSPKISQGSCINRNSKAEKIIELTHDTFEKIGFSENIPLRTLKNIIKKVLPEKKYIKLSPLSKKADSGGRAMLHLDKMNKYDGYMIELPLSDTGYLSIYDIPTFTHEFTHVLNKLFNSKLNITSFKIDKIASKKKYSNYYKKRFDFYNKSLYTEENFLRGSDCSNIIEKRKKEVLDFLKNRTTEEKISILQEFRYYLEDEFNAYKTTLWTYNWLYDKEKQIPIKDFKFLVMDNYVYIANCVDRMLLPEKINMLKDLCYKEIQNARGKTNSNSKF